MARTLGGSVYPKAPSRTRPRGEERRAGSSCRPCRPRAWARFRPPLARGRYWRSMKPGPRAINEDGIDRQKAQDTRCISRKRAMRAVLLATNAAKENPVARIGLRARPFPGRVTSSGTERPGRRPPTATQSHAGWCRRKPPTCVGKWASKPSFRDAKERRSRSIDRIDRATTRLDKAPAKRVDLRRSIRGRYSPFAGDVRQRYRPPDAPQASRAGGAGDADGTSGPWAVG